MIISAYEIMKAVVKCCGSECIKDSQVAYFGDTNTTKNKTVFIGDTVGEPPFDFALSLRGIPNKGESTSKFARDFLNDFGGETTHTFEYLENDITKYYRVTIYIPFNFEYDGIDDKGRTQLSSTAKIKKIKEVNYVN